MTLPPVALHHSWEELVEIMARLRMCCPWDMEQTHETLLPYLVEEAHEVVEAVDEVDPKQLCEALGDLLLQIVFHSQIAPERGQFAADDVTDTRARKMYPAHPGGFAGASITTQTERR